MPRLFFDSPLQPLQPHMSPDVDDAVGSAIEGGGGAAAAAVLEEVSSLDGMDPDGPSAATSLPLPQRMYVLAARGEFRVALATTDADF